MKFAKIFAKIVGLLFLSQVAFAYDHNSIVFFSSNNTHEITVETAYERLRGEEQQNLQDNIISVMQKNHIEQGKLEDIIGAYTSSTSQSFTADNTDIFNTSPYQKLSNEKAFMLAQKLAIMLNQESVGVFIPTKESIIGDITVRFTTYQPTIIEAINLLQNKLPPAYSRAFSLHLNNKYSNFKEATVSEIEWLGSNLKLAEIKDVFPQEKVLYRYGSAYLVYKNGQKERL